MKKLVRCALGIAVMLLTGCTIQNENQPSPTDEALGYCHRQVLRTLADLRGDSAIDYTMMPRNILEDSTRWHCRKATPDEWCAGFWPGILWLDYEATGDTAVLGEARRFTASLEYLSQRPAFDHDLGFLMFCSYGNGYRLTGDPHYKDVILATADTLARLFNPNVGTILSWPRNTAAMGGHNTIMDNMINLEMLFWASKNGGADSLYDIAVSHASTTMRHHFRPDFTCYHVAVYDSVTGDFIKGVTHQGYSDNSAWARGQSWAIYGFTMAFRETGDSTYLNFVQSVADTYLGRLPEDKIPYWDFDDPAIPDAPRDASAACVTASALVELSQYVEPQKGKAYLDVAKSILASLATDVYRSGERKPSFLLHSTGNRPKNSEVNASIIYADYYYIEALNRLKNLEETK